MVQVWEGCNKTWSAFGGPSRGLASTNVIFYGGLSVLFASDLFQDFFSSSNISAQSTFNA